MTAMIRTAEVSDPVMLVAPPAEYPRWRNGAMTQFPGPGGETSAQFAFDGNQLSQDLYHDLALLAAMVSPQKRSGSSSLVTG